MGEVQEKQGWESFSRIIWELFHKPYLSGSEETLVSCQIILSTDFSQGPRTASNLSTVSLSCSQWWLRSTLYWKPEPFPLQPACRVMATWELSYQCSLSSSWKSCSPWVAALFMCFQVWEERPLAGSTGNLAPMLITWGRKMLPPPEELQNPPTSLKCASPQCHGEAMPWNSVSQNPHFQKKKRNKQIKLLPPTSLLCSSGKPSEINKQIRGCYVSVRSRTCLKALPTVSSWIGFVLVGKAN